jgi:hypothetical protein
MNNVVSYSCNDLLVFWVEPYNISNLMGYVRIWHARRVGIVYEQISS